MTTETNHRPSAVRPRKKERLPQVIKLAAGGLNAREIGEKLDLNKSTVGHWLREARLKRVTKARRDPALALCTKIEYYESRSDELYEEWRRSKADKQVQVVEKTGPADEEAPAKKKTSIRTETRAGNPTFFDKSTEAREIADFFREQLAALLGIAPAGPGGPPGPLANLTDNDLERLTPDDLENFSDDQLFALQARLRAAAKRRGVKSQRPPLTSEVLRNMNAEELRALEKRLRAEIEAQVRRVSPPETEPVAPGNVDPPPGEVGSQKPLAKRTLLPEPAGAENAAAAAPSCTPAAAVEEKKAEKVDPPRLTWDQQHEIALREEAAKKAARELELKRFTDPNYCAYR